MHVGDQTLLPSAERSIYYASSAPLAHTPNTPPTQLTTIPNFRDVGAIINGYKPSSSFGENTARQPLRTGILFRGARPDEASFQDKQRLLKDYKIKSIVDLRTKTEHIEQARRRDARIRTSAAVPQSNEDVAKPLKIPGIKYHDINFNGSAFSRMLISKLSWLEFFWLIVLMLFGYRLDAVKILAPHMESMGLSGLATESLDVCTKEVRKFFEVLTDEQNLPVFVHCTQGKDRTGLVIMLVLFLLGVSEDAITYDYMLSGPALEPERQERLKEIASIGLSEHFASVPPDVVELVHRHIHARYGGIEAYLESVGVDIYMRNQVKRLLLA
ncbi:uncharacterized protein EI97DRAFT_428860 [Westerdykella ornata]|uniref:Tyrosine specific protein phosphatases domain-containing protein n=1 Tax=Westerdykella ornata TaxID=318751 RepID=A0A6A6JWZ3_WESOR|nr:uncharacterized protein EI97DRAFT_428860 [Westerdykella ornata]KAF2280755.1 hypothetical protein EI97DRAFT_428860 [Westerdykella ornata]